MTAAGVVEPRPAATVVLLRPGTAGLEVLLTHRPATMAFAGGAHVFPGGRVDPSDSDPALAARSVLAASDAAVALGGDLDPAAALAAHVAALRELFEEAGVLLADTGASPARIGEGRSALLRGEVTLPDLALELDLTLRTDRLVPLSRWVTPVVSPRRFDTRFFAALLPDGAEPSFEGGEVVGARLAPPDRRARGDGRRAPRPVAADEHDPPAARVRHVARRDPRADVARRAWGGRRGNRSLRM